MDNQELVTGELHNLYMDIVTLPSGEHRIRRWSTKFFDGATVYRQAIIGNSTLEIARDMVDLRLDRRKIDTLEPVPMLHGELNIILNALEMKR